MPQRFHLSLKEERLRYDKHQNFAHDPDYRAFLNRLLVPLMPYLKEGQNGLDFGCGPGPTLAVMMREQGYTMTDYDPFYAANVQSLQQHYDFITCTEAIEHFKQPHQEWRRWLSLLHEGGVLAIMTQLYDAIDDFGRWYYKNDPTHISFFSRASFEWLALRDGLEVNFYARSVIILQKG